MAFWRAGEAVVAFSNHPSFNFMGPALVRRQLRSLRAAGIGATKYGGIAMRKFKGYRKPGRSFVLLKHPFIDCEGNPSIPRWVCDHRDVVEILQQMEFRCPRCWSDERPRRLKPEFLCTWHDLDEVLRPSPLLCDECREMSDLRGHRRTVGAAREIVALQREMKHLLRIGK